MRFSILRTFIAGVPIVLGCLDAPSIAADKGIAVEVRNASEPVLCAEKDNVTLELVSTEVRAFRIEAAHPAYISTLQRDSFEPDWAQCDMSKDPAVASPVTAPVRRTIYEEPDFWLVGWTFPTYWRASTATVRVGDRVEQGLHLVQLWQIRPMGGEEILVFYPQDGYWRARPLAPEGRAPTAFGSSFLVGPVEVDGRPLVKFKEVAFDPKSRAFSLAFERGGTAVVKLASVDRDRLVLDISLGAPITPQPFAALRSMYVTEFNNDVAQVAVREPSSKGWTEGAILTFRSTKATEIWAGRHQVSRHNSSSPDMIFKDFSGPK